MVSVSKVIFLVAVLLGIASAFIVSAKAERRVAKTEVDVEFIVTGEDKDPAKALDKAQGQAAKLSKAVEKLSTKNGIYISEPGLEAVLSGDKVTGYKSEIEVEIDLEDSKTLGKVVELGSKFGVLSDVEYEIDESEEELVKTELVKEAFEEAQEKAKAYAAAIGVTLGEIDTIEIEDLTDEEEDDLDESSDTSVEVHLLYGIEDAESETESKEEEELATTEAEEPKSEKKTAPAPSKPAKK